MLWSCWRHWILMQIWWRRKGGHFENAVGYLISRQSCKLVEGVVGFPKSYILLPTQKNNCCNQQIAMATPWSNGTWFDESEPQKEEAQTSYNYITQRRVWTLTIKTSKEQMMLLGSVPGVWTQALGWWHQEICQCASAVTTQAILWVSHAQGYCLELAHVWDCSKIPVKSPVLIILSSVFGLPLVQDHLWQV